MIQNKIHFIFYIGLISVACFSHVYGQRARSTRAAQVQPNEQEKQALVEHLLSPQSATPFVCNLCSEIMVFENTNDAMMHVADMHMPQDSCQFCKSPRPGIHHYCQGHKNELMQHIKCGSKQ
jgi:anion-transporting  ArsA/GET3 family ATPase